MKNSSTEKFSIRKIYNNNKTKGKNTVILCAR